LFRSAFQKKGKPLSWDMRKEKRKRTNEIKLDDGKKKKEGYRRITITKGKVRKATKREEKRER